MRNFSNFVARVGASFQVIPTIYFLAPILLMYLLNPQSFEYTWKGRTYYLFFFFIRIVEAFFSSSSIKRIVSVQNSKLHTLSFMIMFMAPTLYVVGAHYSGLNEWISTWAIQHNMFLPNYFHLCVEYLTLSLLNTLFLLCYYGLAGLRDYAISSIFLIVISLIYTIDNLYPYGYFSLFQVFVPTAVLFAEKILQLLHYQTLILSLYERGAVHLMVWNAERRVVLGVAWPCAGIDSLILYALTVVLFLNKSDIPRKQKVGYFLIGAIVTYLVNILRIVTVFQIAMNGGDYSRFHDYYGPLFSITWILSYLFIIVASRFLWQRWSSSQEVQ